MTLVSVHADPPDKAVGVHELLHESLLTRRLRVWLALLHSPLHLQPGQHFEIFISITEQRILTILTPALHNRLNPCFLELCVIVRLMRTPLAQVPCKISTSRSRTQTSMHHQNVHV